MKAEKVSLTKYLRTKLPSGYTLITKPTDVFNPPCWQLEIDGERGLTAGQKYLYCELSYFRNDGDDNKADNECEKLLTDMGWTDSLRDIVKVDCYNYPTSPTEKLKEMELELIDGDGWQNEKMNDQASDLNPPQSSQRIHKYISFYCHYGN